MASEQSIDDNRLEQLEKENKNLRNRLDNIEEELSEQDNNIPISRRSALTGLAAAGLFGFGATGNAAAVEEHDHLGETWTGDPSGNALEINIPSRGILTESTDTDGINWGLRGESHSDEGRAVWGFNRSTSGGDAIGVYGRTNSSSGDGVFGLATPSEGSGVAAGVRGEVNWETGRGIIGINRATEGNAYGVHGWTRSSEGVGFFGSATADEGETKGVRGRAVSPDGIGVEGANTANDPGDGQDPIGVLGTTNADDGYGLYSETNVHIEGDLEVEGTKHFVQAVETPSGSKQVSYNAVESGRAHTETTDNEFMEDGEAKIDLPEHFDLVTSEEEPLSVQVTPHAEEKVHPQVVEKSTKHLVVKDFSCEDISYEFSYTVKGVREGFEEEDIIEDKDTV